jgi:polynucleotide 5'-kinase involved in rRNA processing
MMNSERVRRMLDQLERVSSIRCVDTTSLIRGPGMD